MPDDKFTFDTILDPVTGEKYIICEECEEKIPIPADCTQADKITIAQNHLRDNHGFDGGYQVRNPNSN